MKVDKTGTRRIIQKILSLSSENTTAKVKQESVLSLFEQQWNEYFKIISRIPKRGLEELEKQKHREAIEDLIGVLKSMNERGEYIAKGGGLINTTPTILMDYKKFMEEMKAEYKRNKKNLPDALKPEEFLNKQTHTIIGRWDSKFILTINGLSIIDNYGIYMNTGEIPDDITDDKTLSEQLGFT